METEVSVNNISHVEDGRVSPHSSQNWPIFGFKFPRSEVVFFSQVILIYIVVITAVVNISLGSKDLLWSHLLVGSVGFLLPNPSIKLPPKQNEHI